MAHELTRASIAYARAFVAAEQERLGSMIADEPVVERAAAMCFARAFLDMVHEGWSFQEMATLIAEYGLRAAHPSVALTGLNHLDVCCWHLTDVSDVRSHVRFRG